MPRKVNYGCGRVTNIHVMSCSIHPNCLTLSLFLFISKFIMLMPSPYVLFMSSIYKSSFIPLSLLTMMSMILCCACHPSIVKPYYEKPPLHPLQKQQMYLDLSSFHPATKIYIHDRFVGYVSQYNQGILRIHKKWRRLSLQRRGYASAYYFLKPKPQQKRMKITVPLIKLPAHAPHPSM